MASIRIRVAQSLKPLHRWLLPVGALVTFTGYVRPWIDHKAAGLAVLGLDLGELVKFLHPVQQGEIRLWREGFYLPLVAVSVSLSLNAFRRGPAPSGDPDRAKAGAGGDATLPCYGWPLRVAFLLMAVVAALNLLPPAWTPRLLLTTEFRLQTVLMIGCLALAALSPFAALLYSPRSLIEREAGPETGANRRGFLWGAVWTVAFLSVLVPAAVAVSAVYFPLVQFRQVLPTLAELYGHPPEIGWGPAAMVAGLAALIGHGLRDIVLLVRK